MITRQDILRRGYFPKELPPPFTTADFAIKQQSLSSSLKKESSCLRFSYSRYAAVRRTLFIPNPAHMIRLADVVSENWASIDAHCSKSTLSRTLPKPDAKRALAGSQNLNELPVARAEIRAGAQYVLRADVANFYGSVYTHAIPWAFHTKEVAKANRSSKRSKAGGPPLFGNVLDEASRDIQSGQTVGLPVGPDTSFVIAEAILCAADALITERIGPDIMGFRFADDYEFACTSLTEAEQARAAVQDALAEFELHLNLRKTRIIELPDALDTIWIHELASFEFSSTKKSAQESQILRYFSRAFALVRENPGEPVLKYAVRRLSEVDFPQSHHLLQRLLFQAATIDPGTLHTALYVTSKHQQAYGPDAVDKPTLTRSLSAIIQRHAPLQHGGDVAWALWGAIVFGVSLNNMVVDAIERLTDPVATLTALHAEQAGRLMRPLNKANWTETVTSAELFDSRWLLAYEGFGKGWLPSPAGDPAGKDPFFADARSEAISFYDMDVSREIPEPSPVGEYI